MRVWILTAGLGVAALLVYLLSNLIPASGAFASLDSRLVDQCAKINVFPGTEDVTIDPGASLAFVSGADRRAAFAGSSVRGGIFTIDLADDNTVRRVSPDAPADFQPHGISLWRGENGEKRLFVVNHPASGHTVEIFDISETGDLAHIETVSFDAMHSPNDVLAVGPRQFYATNDHGFDGGIMGTLEAYLALPFSSVVYYDGVQGREIEKGLVYANGVNISADGSTVYVAELLKRRIAAFSRDAETGEITRQRNYKVNTSPDNIEVAGDGALWTGGHSKIFDFLKHAENPSAIAPSHVVRIDPQTGDAEDIFIDTRGVINASSVGAVWDDILIVGAVFDGHVMICPLSPT